MYKDLKKKKKKKTPASILSIPSIDVEFGESSGSQGETDRFQTLLYGDVTRMQVRDANPRR